MNLNRLYTIFRSHRLEREDIKTYGSTNDPQVKNAIEQKLESDPFQSDALEGWEQLSYNTEQLSRLDKKFGHSSNTGWYIFSAAVVAVMIPIVFFLVKPSEKVATTTPLIPETIVTTLSEDQQITLDESDLIISEAIQKMELAPSKSQVKPTLIQKDFKEMSETRENEVPIQIDRLPIHELDPTIAPTPEITKKHELAKEIYLRDLKLVDYRKYREKPQIKTKQMVLTGTPAYKEDKTSNELETDWKDVDVPYIEFIDKSMRIFNDGNYKKALSRYETILATYSEDVNAHFYAGVCLYNMGEYSSAIDHFNQCIQGSYSNFDEEAQWMTALSYEKTGNKTVARKIFTSISTTNGFYAQQAKDKLK